MTTKLEESGGILVGLVETIFLPVVGVICELNRALDVWSRL
jgi:hypothetical protein